MHIEKYKFTNLKSIIKHYDREHITKNVNQELSQNNVYFYSNDLKNYLQEHNKKLNANNISEFAYNYIIDKTQKVPRKDANVLHDIIITQPKSYGKNFDKNFFDTAIKSLQNYEYNGKKIFENVLMYSIHNDEKGQPHLHYSYLPIYANDKVKIRKNENKKTDKTYTRNSNYRLNSDYLDKKFLKNFHRDFERFSGLKDLLLPEEERTKNNYSMKEYQAHQDQMQHYQNYLREKELAEIEKEKAEKQKAEKEKAKEENKKVSQEIDNIKNDTEIKRQTLSSLTQKQVAEELDNRNKNILSKISDFDFNVKGKIESIKIIDPNSIKITFDKPKEDLLKNNYIVPKKDYLKNLEKICDIYQKAMIYNLSSFTEKFQTFNNEIENIENIKNENIKLYSQVGELKQLKEQNAELPKLRENLKIYKAENEILHEEKLLITDFLKANNINLTELLPKLKAQKSKSTDYTR
jgi:hypothetical protein